ncbi:MAG: helix-turn-helix domain-containing protein [Bacteroidia bacterium]|nr:helix-turn-helix domain-containing protein [Bacteroidia bacterium]
MRGYIGIGFWLFVLWGIFLTMADAQTTFILERVPLQTPAGDTIFVTGSFNDWNPGDPAYIMRKRTDGKYVLTLGKLKPPFEYKYTRGSWPRGEADGLGKPQPNRIQQEGNMPLTLADEIFGWEDLPSILPIARLKVVLEEIPENTPQDASLFITGSFNSWLPGDPFLKFQKMVDNTYEVEFPIYKDTIEFKINRGNWESVEGRKSGRARFNRRYVVKETSPEVLQIKVESWEDLSGTPINAYTIFWLMAAIQGILLILVINTLQRPVPRANLILSLLLFVFSMALLARVAVYDREIFQWMPKLLLIPDFLYFLYAPLFVAYVRTLLRVSDEAFSWKTFLPFLPFLIHFIDYFDLLLMANRDFINLSVDQRLQTRFEWLGGMAFVYNLVYWIYSWNLIRAYQEEADNQFSAGSSVNLLKYIMILKALCLFIWALLYIFGAYALFKGGEHANITDVTTDIVWMTFSFTVFLLGYFALKEPDIFRLPEKNNTLLEPNEILPSSSEPKIPEQVKEIDEDLKARLIRYMDQEEPFLNPKLNLSELAGGLEIHSHELSRIINQGFNKNFNDFVNAYRVEKFKKLLQEPSFENHTFLAIAFHVGFNSKTAFNRSFKKLTGHTPRDYMNSIGKTTEK